MTSDKDRLRSDRAELVAALTVAGATFHGSAVKCPFHDDRHPSASIYRGEDGAWRLKCHGCQFCGDVIDVMAQAQGRKPEDVLKELSPTPSNAAPPTPPKAKRIFATIDDLAASIRNVEAIYRYTHPTTRAVELVVIRSRDGDGKRFIQARPVPAGFVMEAGPKPWPIYNRIRVATAEKVIVVEGEKCVHALADIGIVATTSPGGAGKAAYTDWRPLAGKTVYLWPDNDAPDEKRGNRRQGIEHMREVAEQLHALEPPANVLWIDPDCLSVPIKGDVVEFIAMFGGATPAEQQKAVLCALEVAEPLGAVRDLADLMDETISGKRRAIPWPWNGLSRLSRSILPGTVTLLCGDPGSTKSFLVLEAAWYWHREKLRVAIYELEEDRAYHLNRALAQVDGNGDLTDCDWVYAHPNEARDALSRHSTFLNDFGRCVQAAPDKQVSLDELATWIRQKAEAGFRIIIIDPVTAADAGESPWIDDLKFLMTVKAIARKHGASLILVTHPKKGRKTPGASSASLDDLAGGAAYPRFSQTVLWINRHDKPKRVRIAGPTGDFTARINRSIRIAKCRNGPGAGLELGFNFDGGTLRFSEQGIVLKGEADDDNEEQGE